MDERYLRESRSISKMSDRERLAGYEQDKRRLLTDGHPMTAAEYSERVKALAYKWRV